MEPVGVRPGGLPTSVTVATVIAAIQGGLGILIGLVLVGRGRRIRRLGIGLTGARLRGAGVVLLLAGVALIVVCVGLARLRPWARIAAFVLEGLSVLSNVLRLGGARPGAAVVGIVVSGAVIAALLTASARGAFVSPALPPPT
ncbi:MAG TPA: hypothetical protein VFE55_01955 [Acidimicrobiia bacterium]|nr:hypothetical protein [Acidimicrobiia bacterium]